MKDAGKDIEQSNLLTQASERRKSYANSRPVSYTSQVSYQSHESEELSFADPFDADATDDVDGCLPEQDKASIEIFKEILSGTSSEIKSLKVKKQEEEERWRNKFLYASFTDLCKETENNETDLENFVHGLFARLSFGQPDIDTTESKESSVMEDPEPYQRYFPELYTC